MAPNTRPWKGVDTLLNANEFSARHLRNPQRPPLPNHTLDNPVLQHTAAQGGQSSTIFDRIRQVYYSLLQFDDHEDEWRFSRLLGAGSFGVAALYQKRRDNKIVDELVVKTETPLPVNFVHPTRRDISKEIWHMAQLNAQIDAYGKARQQRHGAVQVLGYRYIQGDLSTQDGVTPLAPRDFKHQYPFYQEWRTFMENCSFGSLTRVIQTYRAWGYHIPEAFIWWTFHWLIDACKAMEEDFFTEDLSDPWSVEAWPNSFMLHNDLKSENCFVGMPRPELEQGVPFDDYPAVRMGDFGLSTVVAIDGNNRPNRLPPGTLTFLPPEKRRIVMDLRNPAYLFYNRDRVDSDQWHRNHGIPINTKAHAIGPEANIWGVGIIIYLLMTLGSVDTIDRKVHDILSVQNPTRDDPTVDQYLFEMSDFNTSLPENEDYGYILKRLVRECTRMEPLQRPVCREVLECIDHCIEEERNRLQMEFGDDDAIREATRMALTNEDWQSVPNGPYTMMPTPIPNIQDRGIQLAWQKFHESVTAWDDPDAPKLIPPIQARFQPPGLSISPTYLGLDSVMYVDRDFIADYYQGPPLPNGGRARAAPQQVDNQGNDDIAMDD